MHQSDRVSPDACVAALLGALSVGAGSFAVLAGATFDFALLLFVLPALGAALLGVFGLRAIRRSASPLRGAPLAVGGLMLAGVGGALALLLAGGEASEARARAETARRLGRVVRALRAYAEAHEGKLPPAATYGPDGLPLHSWRVLILPFLGHADLHRRFRLDEPWDSPHNLALLP